MSPRAAVTVTGGARSGVGKIKCVEPAGNSYFRQGWRGKWRRNHSTGRAVSRNGEDAMRKYLLAALVVALTAPASDACFRGRAVARAKTVTRTVAKAGVTPVR